LINSRRSIFRGTLFSLGKHLNFFDYEIWKKRLNFTVFFLRIPWKVPKSQRLVNLSYSDKTSEKLFEKIFVRTQTGLSHHGYVLIVYER